MIYDKLTIYPCISDNEPKEKISACIYHNSDDENLIYTINSSLFKERFDDVFIFIPFNKRISIDISNYPEYNWIFAYKEYNYVEILKVLKKEIVNDLLFLIPSNYKIKDIKVDDIVSLFTQKENLLAVAPFIYDNSDNLFPTLSMPKIENTSISYVMIPPKYSLNYTLFAFDMIAVYNLKKINFDIPFNTVYKDENFKYFDYFTSFHLSGYVSFISSLIEVKYFDSNNQTVRNFYKKDIKIISSKFMSFINTGSPYASLKPFWWLNYNVIDVVKYVLPFIKFAKQDYYNLVKNWRIEV